MQTFKLDLGIEFRVVVPAGFLAEARKEAQAPEATEFLRQLQAAHVDDDDGFMLGLIKNATRTEVRRNLVGFLEQAGLGASVAPVRVPVFEALIPEEKPTPVKEVTVKAPPIVAGELLPRDSSWADVPSCGPTGLGA